MALFEWLLQADIFQILLVFVLALSVTLLSRRFLESFKLPPGPWGLPIVGYQPFLNKRALAENFKALSERYGPMFSMRLGERLTIVLSDYESVRDTIIRKSEIFSGRMDGFTIMKYFGNHISTIVTDGDVWRDQRRFLLTTLRDFGFAKLSLEGVIHEEAEALKTYLSDTNGKPEDLALLMNKVAANVICHLLFGQRFEYDHEKLGKLLEVNDETGRNFEMISYKDTLWFARFLPKSWTHLDDLQKSKKHFFGFIEDRIIEHEETFDPDNLRDLVDVYLLKMKESQKSGESTKNSIFTRKHMAANAVLLFAAGLDTTSTSLIWAFKMMLLYPEIQKKLQEEVDSVVGRARLPSWTDRPNLVYTEATILEVLRFSSFLPVNVPHTNMEETSVNGYTIPKRSTILMNLWQMNNDPKYWKNPEEFNPSRFIDENGKIKRTEYFMPFSSGARVCLGESLARMELFIFFATVIQNFNLLPPKGEKVTLDTSTAGVRKLDHFKIMSVLRS